MPHRQMQTSFSLSSKQVSKPGNLPFVEVDKRPRMSVVYFPMKRNKETDGRQVKGCDRAANGQSCRERWTNAQGYKIVWGKRAAAAGGSAPRSLGSLAQRTDRLVTPTLERRFNVSCSGGAYQKAPMKLGLSVITANFN